jgi:hypothetical protein
VKRRTPDELQRRKDVLAQAWLPFDLEDLQMDDHTLGQRIGMYYYLAVREEHGRRWAADDPKFIELVLQQIPEASTADEAAVEKALKKAAAGEYETAGRIFREWFLAGARNMANANLVARYLADRAKVQASRKAGGRGRAAKFASTLNERDAAVLKDFRVMYDQGIPNKDAVGKLAGKYSLSKSTIRKIVGKARAC